MRRASSIVAALACVAIGGGGIAAAPAAASPVVVPASQITLRAPAGADVGTVLFSERDGQVHVRVRASGLTPGFHGFHVHSVGQCDGSTTPPFTSAGGHWSPDSAAHGAHDGDMPPLFANADGAVTEDFVTDAFTVAALRDNDGAAVIVHAAPDNLGNIPARYSFTNADGSTGTGPDAATKATGDSGARVACGVLSTASSGPQYVNSTRGRTARAALRTAAGAAAGLVRFSPVGTDRVHVSVDASGLTPGFHGFHVHSVGQCDGTTPTPFSSAGGHLGAGGSDHGKHAGDMPALFANADGRARAEFDTDAYTLAQVLDADGGALVIHAAPDNLANIPTRYSFTNADGSAGTGPDAVTKATGDSGGRVLCGVVAVPPPPATVGLRLDFPVVTAGNTPLLLCSVKDAAGAGAPDVEVTFFAKRYGETAYTQIGSGFSDEAGAVSLVVRPETQTAYVARVTGLPDARALVAVNARVTVTSLTGGPVGQAPSTVAGRVLPAYVGAPVGLGVITGSGAAARYTYLGQTTTTAGGEFRITASFPAETSAYIVYVSARHGTRRGSTSRDLTGR
ncbi:MAG TPA: superoxide dismutase family protein [Mycobacteriales bacterium]|nr:superoxide dismutase family protein [Mycobacteriales bacterium]